MNNMTELMVGFAMMIESSFHYMKIHAFNIEFLISFAILSLHYLLSHLVKGKRARIIIGTVAAVSVTLISICFFVSYHNLYMERYGIYVPSKKPADLECNLQASLEEELYLSIIGDRHVLLPAISTPPPIFCIRLLTHLWGDNLDQYAVNYHKLEMVILALIFLSMVAFAFETLGRKWWNESNILISFSVITFLFLFPLASIDMIWGNTNLFVGVLIAIQVLLTRWQNNPSKFMQGFILALAWWIKPNIVLVELCLVVYAVSRKEYEYLYGMAGGILIPFFASLWSPNITFQTYMVYFTKVSDVIERLGFKNYNFSLIEHLSDRPQIVYKICLAFAALLVTLFTLKLKSSLLELEVFSFSLTYLVWTLFWNFYLIPFVVIVWALMVQQQSEKRRISVYLTTAFMLLLAYTTIMQNNTLSVNILLFSFAAAYALQCLGKQSKGQTIAYGIW